MQAFIISVTVEEEDTETAETPPVAPAESTVEEVQAEADVIDQAEADVIQIVDDPVPTPTPEMVSHKQGIENGRR